MISVPKNIKLIEWPASTVWFNEDGILYSISKKVHNRTLEETKKTVDDLKQLVGDKKICMLIDVTNATPTSRELREYSARILPEFVKAIAMVSTSAVGKMLANLFFAIRPQNFPAKVFSSEESAREWLKQYL